MANQRSPALLRAFPEMFYGWIVMAGAGLLAFVVVGSGFYCLAVLFDGLCREHGWSSTQVALPTSLFFVTTGLTGAAIGRGVDRFGPRVFFVPGASIMAIAFVWIGRIEEPWQLNLAYPLLAIGFATAGTVPNNALVARWFVGRRALAMSLSQTGVSVGGILLVPLTTAVIIERGVAVATQGLALLVLGLTTFATLFFVRSSPESMGQRPDGPRSEFPTRVQLDGQRRHWSSREVLATPTFWVVVVAFSGILLCQVGTAMHQLAMLRQRIDPTTASLAVSSTAFGSVVARLFVGRFADRWSKRWLGAGLMLAQAAALTIFALSTRPWMLFVASLLFGCTVGNIFMLQALIVGEVFGMASFGKAYGMLQMITQLASGLGPFVLSLLVESLGSYRAGLWPLVALAALSAVMLLRLRAPSAPGSTASTR